MTNTARKLINRIEQTTVPMSTDERRDTLCAIHEYLAQRIVAEDVARRNAAKRQKEDHQKLIAGALIQLGAAK